MGDYEADAPRASGGRQRGHGPDSARLLALLESASAGSDALNAKITEALYGTPSDALAGLMALGVARTPNYTTSLDAAMTLVPEGTQLMLSRALQPDMGGKQWRVSLGRQGTRASARTPALAICIAAIRALAPPDARASGASHTITSSQDGT